jgi:hypothetical protein
VRYRKLRIAWTVFCGIACVLLIALWVLGSRWSFETIGFGSSGNQEFSIWIFLPYVGVAVTDFGPVTEKRKLSSPIAFRAAVPAVGSRCWTFVRRAVATLGQTI